MLSREHRRFKRGTASMAARFEGSSTSHNGSVNFLGDGTIFWGSAREFKRFRGAAGGGFHEQFRWERGSTRHTTTWRGFRKRSRRDGNGVRNGPASSEAALMEGRGNLEFVAPFPVPGSRRSHGRVRHIAHIPNVNFEHPFQKL